MRGGGGLGIYVVKYPAVFHINVSKVLWAIFASPHCAEHVFQYWQARRFQAFEVHVFHDASQSTTELRSFRKLEIVVGTPFVPRSQYLVSSWFGHGNMNALGYTDALAISACTPGS